MISKKEFLFHQTNNQITVSVRYKSLIYIDYLYFINCILSQMKIDVYTSITKSFYFNRRLMYCFLSIFVMNVIDRT